jgi:peroxiredoxin
MKHTLFLLIIFNLFAACTATATPDEPTGYNIQVSLDGYNDQDMILGYYYNKKMYVSDTSLIENGTALFKDETALPGGLYLFYLPDGKFFDVLINDEQHFAIETDTANLIGQMKITGAKEPQLFLDYQRFIEQQQKKVTELREDIKTHESDQTKVEELSKELEATNKEVADYWDAAIEQYPGTFYAQFIKSMKEPVMPAFEIPEEVQNKDSVRQIRRYEFYRDHYFDNMDFSDERLLRTPFFVQKLETYFERMLVQMPDTIVKASVDLIERSRENEEMFRFLVQFTFNKANESKIMGMDAAMVALAEKYYLTGEADWASEEFLETLATRVRDIKPTLIGKKAHDMQMESNTGQIFRLHEVNAEVTILVFYEPSCGHCKKAIPKLYNEVFEPFRNKGVQVFAVYSMADPEEWQAFIDQHELYDWINVYDPNHQTRFRNYYDIRSTPMIYVLDRQKNIAAKRLEVEQLPGFIDHLLKQQ